MADLYSLVSTDATPFSAKLASDRASDVIDSYLNNAQLKASNSTTIRKHLDALEADKNASLLSDMMVDLNAESIASAGLTDQNLLVYLEVERALKDRHPEAALLRLSEELLKATDKRFKELLLHRRFVCSMQLNRLRDAEEAAKEMLSLEPENFYVALSECSLLEKRRDRVAYLEKLKAAHPFSSLVLNRFAKEVRDGVEGGDKSVGSRKMEDVIGTLKRSLEIDPSLGNKAWSTLFTIYSKQPGTKTRELLADIVDAHLTQDAFSAKTSAMLLRFCRKFETVEYKGRQLVDYLQDAYRRHFPREYTEHADVFVEACTEFDAIAALQKVLEDVREKDEVKDDPDFALTMMEVYYDVFRDLNGAISYGRDYLRRNRKVQVERYLLHLYLANGANEKARDLHFKLQGAIDHTQWLRIDATIMEHEGRYQNAVDLIEKFPDRRDFAEQFTSPLSYLDLKMGLWGRAVKRCKDFLNERAFNLRFETEIINYEFAKKMDGGKIDPKRLSNIAQITERQMVKGVCLALMGEDEKALRIFRDDAAKRFSRIDECLRWPAVACYSEKLHEIRNDLLKAPRSLTGNATHG